MQIEALIIEVVQICYYLKRYNIIGKERSYDHLKFDDIKPYASKKHHLHTQSNS